MEDVHHARHAPRPFWTGSISIGLVNVPIRMVSFIRDHGVSFRMLHRTDGRPLHYERVCEGDHEPVPWEDVAKGYEIRPGEYLVFEKEELEAIRPESDRRIHLDRFVFTLLLDPVYFQNAYLLLPDKNPEAYALLLAVLRKKGRAGIGRITIRTKEYPALVREWRDALILTTLHYPDEVLDPRDFEEIQELSVPDEKELGLAVRIIDQLSGDIDLTQYNDRYRERLEALIGKKLEGGTVTVEKPPSVEAKELMDALEETLARLEGTGES